MGGRLVAGHDQRVTPQFAARAACLAMAMVPTLSPRKRGPGDEPGSQGIVYEGTFSSMAAWMFPWPAR